MNATILISHVLLRYSSYCRHSLDIRVAILEQAAIESRLSSIKNSKWCVMVRTVEKSAKRSSRILPTVT